MRNDEYNKKGGMNYNLIPFNFKGNDVRVIEDTFGNPWWIAHDICEILGIKNPRDAISGLDDDEKNTVVLTDGIRGNPNINVINESGLYSMILRSRKKKAKEFRKWVTSEVLPAIRKSGRYDMNQTAMTPAERLLKACEIAVENERRTMQLEIEQIKVKTDVVHHGTRLDYLEAQVIQEPDYFSVTAFARINGIKVDTAKASSLGRKAKQISQQEEIPVSAVKHPRWGHVGAYHTSVLERVFAPLLEAQKPEVVQ